MAAEALPHSSQDSPPSSKPLSIARVPELDGIRGLATFSILAWHYVHRVLLAPEPGTAFAYLKSSLFLSWSGVDLFFVLSGFLIAGILMDNRDTKNYYRLFYLRRICRTFPLYYLLIAAYLTLSPFYVNYSSSKSWESWETFVWNPAIFIGSYLTFTQNLSMAFYGGFGAFALAVTWSLAIEEQFYLLFPILIRWTPRSLLPLVLLCGALAAPILRTVVPWSYGFFLMPCRIDPLFVGALLAYIFRTPPALAFLERHKAGLYPVLAVLLLGTVHTGAYYDKTAFGGLGFTWVALLYAVMIVIALLRHDSIIARVARTSSLVWLGQVSYGVYLFHLPILDLVHGWVRHRTPTLDDGEGLILTVGSLIATLVLAQLLHSFVERPIIALGHRLRYMTGTKQTC